MIRRADHNANSTPNGRPDSGRPTPAGPRFAPGRILATPGALEALARAGRDPAARVTALLARHLAGDWGDVDAHDWQANEQALATGARLLSAYTLPTGVRLWAIADAIDDEGARPATTLLLPDEY